MPGILNIMSWPQGLVLKTVLYWNKCLKISFGDNNSPRANLCIQIQDLLARWLAYKQCVLLSDEMFNNQWEESLVETLPNLHHSQTGFSFAQKCSNFLLCLCLYLYKKINVLSFSNVYYVRSIKKFCLFLLLQESGLAEKVFKWNLTFPVYSSLVFINGICFFFSSS